MPTRWLQRLADEFDDDGIELPADAEFCRLLLEELDHCRRAPMFEGRRPTYGAIILPHPRAATEHRAALDALDYDLVQLDDDPAAGRVYADGRASFLVRYVDGGVALACFAGSMLMEADLVRLQRKTRAAIIQRTPVLDVVRIAVDEAMVTWDGRQWHRRPTAMALTDALLERVPELDSSFANHVLELRSTGSPRRGSVRRSSLTTEKASTGHHSTPPPQHVHPSCQCAIVATSRPSRPSSASTTWP